jgi:hypothetical protein
MSAIWHDSGMPGFMASAPRFSFHDLPEIVQEAPAAYKAVVEDMRIRERLLGAGWFRHNAELSYQFWLMKRPWWLAL